MSSSELKTCTGKSAFPFMPYKTYFIVLSLVFMAISVYQISIKGIRFGVDFLGGTKLIVKFDNQIDSKKIRESLKNFKIQDKALGNIDIVPFGNDATKNEYILRAKYLEGVQVSEGIVANLKKSFGADKVSLLSQEVVGPKVGQDLKERGIKSILFTCFLILAYIGLRFDFLFSPGAILALLHDIIISVGVFALFGKEFNLPILAAVLTIIGYSINDTIIIYDRIRENIDMLPKSAKVEDIINVSVTETFRRTIVTSLTVLFVVVTLYFIGGGVLQDFAFCLIIGVIFGTYSSIFIASPVYVALQKIFPKQGMLNKSKDLSRTSHDGAVV